MRRLLFVRGLDRRASVSARYFLASYSLALTACLCLTCLCLTLTAAAQDLRLQPADANHVAIPRAAFGKDYLLSASVIPQSGAPTSNGLAGRIVRFELFPDGVDMYESTEGQVVTQDLPAKRLLTTFPIVGQNEASVNIDFNKGMNRVFTGDWYGTGSFYPEENANVLEVVQSRVFEVRQAQNQLLIRQSAQVRDRQYSENEEARFELRYFISPYVPTDLAGKENLERDQRYVRFFEVMPKLEATSGRSTSNIARFDIRQPVVFHYSANTPADYEQAVKDGILYWNRAFGKEVVKAEKAPDGVTAPSPDLNIVQWVPYDNAGFAYADALLDPRNGQTLHGQAYVTSVFAISGKQRARAVLRQLQTTAKTTLKAEKLAAEREKNQPGDRPTKPNRSPNRFGIRFLRPACSCDMNSHEFTKQMITGLQDMLAQGPVSDAKVLLASQDYVRNVTAHEVGHVLGLRHNFAGSLDGNVTPSEMDQWFVDYLTKDAPPEMKDKYTTNSVMEYSAYPAAVFNGWKIRTTTEVLPYDHAAIQWGYMDSNEPKDKKLLFGTDDDIFTYDDLRIFDFGPEPVLSSFAEISKELKLLPNNVIEAFIEYKAPLDPRDAKPLTEVDLNVEGQVSSVAYEYSSMFGWLQSNARSLRLEKDYPFIGDLNREERLKTALTSLTDQVNKAGGIDRLAFSILPLQLTLEVKDPQGVVAPDKFDAAKLTARLAELLDSPAYATFTGADGKTYTFTPEEKELIKARGKAFFESYEKELLKRICQSLGRVSRNLAVEANNGRVADDDFIAKFEGQLVNVAKAVILAKEPSKELKGTNTSMTIIVPDFKYDLETRLAAAEMLNDGVGSYRSWSREARGQLHTELKAQIEGPLGISQLKAFSETSLSRGLRVWYLDQQRLLQMLPPAPPPPMPGMPGAPSANEAETRPPTTE